MALYCLLYTFIYSSMTYPLPIVLAHTFCGMQMTITSSHNNLTQTRNISVAPAIMHQPTQTVALVKGIRDVYTEVSADSDHNIVHGMLHPTLHHSEQHLNSI